MKGALYIGSERPFTRVEYLETADGLPCIDTGIVPTADTKVELGFKCTAAVAWMGVVGNYIDDSHNCVRLAQANNPNRYIANPNTSGSNATTIYKAVSYNWQTASISQTKCIVDDAEATPTLTQGTANTTNIALFKNRVTTSVVGTREQISWCKIYEAGTLVRDFVPVRVGSVGYMLDRLTGTIYGNAGAGAFVIGADIEGSTVLKADCDEQSLALFTYRRENLDNPTVVRNSYSQQIRLAGTPANDAIFGHILQGTRITGGGFDASARTPFVLYGNGGEVLESGYCKLDGIERHGADHTYLVTLFGGLGEILYKLSAADDGRQLTLADLTYIDPDNPTGELDFTLNRATIALAWEVLANQAADDRFTVLNFAHTGDPVPSDFDPSKLFCLGDDIPQTPARTPQVQTGEAVLLSMDNTETRLLPLQVGDFRCYLQRPVLKVSAVFDAIGRYCTDEGWTLSLDGDFFDAGNPYYGASWMTLASFASLGLEQGAAVTKAALLGGTMSPLAFMVGYCRHFGLVITADHIARTLEIRTRANYYDAALPVLDLGPRVDLGEQVAVAPLTYDARWYLMGDEVAGGTATLYGEKYRTPYGWKRIDTGYAFNDEERDLLEGQPFKGAAMVQKLALGADTFYLDNQPAQYRIPAAFWAIGATSPSIATWQLARPHTAGETWTGNVTPGNLQYRTLTEAVLDLTGKDGKVADAFCLLFFDGFHEADDPDGLPASYYVSDDNATWFDTYAGGKRCWLACGTTVTAVTQWPRFNRYTSADGEPRPTGETWDMAVPLENFAPGYDIDAASDIFDTYWAAYLADRYDIDARVATVKADLHGLPRPAELLRHFVWWDGALWSVNAVQEWDPLGEGTTTLELVRVKNPNNYR